MKLAGEVWASLLLEYALDIVIQAPKCNKTPSQMGHNSTVAQGTNNHCTKHDAWLGCKEVHIKEETQGIIRACYQCGWWC